jgi:hypothetical protein
MDDSEVGLSLTQDGDELTAWASRVVNVYAMVFPTSSVIGTGAVMIRSRITSLAFESRKVTQAI